MHTIIGAESFHCPVRDGKEWDQLAMATKLDLSLHSPIQRQKKPIQKKYSGCVPTSDEDVDEGMYLLRELSMSPEFGNSRL